MTIEKILDVIGIYRSHFDRQGITKRAWPREYRVEHGQQRDALAHCHFMLDQMEEFAGNPDKLMKLMRWLGFIQGTLWMSGSFAVAELKNHSRPEK